MKPTEGFLLFLLMLGLGIIAHFMLFYVIAAAALFVTVAHAVQEDKGGRDDHQGF